MQRVTRDRRTITIVPSINYNNSNQKQYQHSNYDRLKYSTSILLLVILFIHVVLVTGPIEGTGRGNTAKKPVVHNTQPGGTAGHTHQHTVLNVATNVPNAQRRIKIAARRISRIPNRSVDQNLPGRPHRSSYNGPKIYGNPKLSFNHQEAVNAFLTIHEDWAYGLAAKSRAQVLFSADKLHQLMEDKLVGELGTDPRIKISPMNLIKQLKNIEKVMHSKDPSYLPFQQLRKVSLEIKRALSLAKTLPSDHDPNSPLAIILAKESQETVFRLQNLLGLQLSAYHWEIQLYRNHIQEAQKVRDLFKYIKSFNQNPNQDSTQKIEAYQQIFERLSSLDSRTFIHLIDFPKIDFLQILKATSKTIIKIHERQFQNAQTMQEKMIALKRMQKHYSKIKPELVDLAGKELQFQVQMSKSRIMLFNAPQIFKKPHGKLLEAIMQFRKSDGNVLQQLHNVDYGLAKALNAFYSLTYPQKPQFVRSQQVQRKIAYINMIENITDSMVKQKGFKKEFARTALIQLLLHCPSDIEAYFNQNKPVSLQELLSHLSKGNFDVQRVKEWLSQHDQSFKIHTTQISLKDSPYVSVSETLINAARYEGLLQNMLENAKRLTEKYTQAEREVRTERAERALSSVRAQLQAFFRSQLQYSQYKYFYVTVEMCEKFKIQAVIRAYQAYRLPQKKGLRQAYIEKQFQASVQKYRPQINKQFRSLIDESWIIISQDKKIMNYLTRLGLISGPQATIEQLYNFKMSEAQKEPNPVDPVTQLNRPPQQPKVPLKTVTPTVDKPTNPTRLAQPQEIQKVPPKAHPTRQIKQFLTYDAQPTVQNYLKTQKKMIDLKKEKDQIGSTIENMVLLNMISKMSTEQRIKLTETKGTIQNLERQIKDRLAGKKNFLQATPNQALMHLVYQSAMGDAAEKLFTSQSEEEVEETLLILTNAARKARTENVQRGLLHEFQQELLPLFQFIDTPNLPLQQRKQSAMTLSWIFLLRSYQFYRVRTQFTDEWMVMVTLNKKSAQFSSQEKAQYSNPIHKSAQALYYTAKYKLGSSLKGMLKVLVESSKEQSPQGSLKQMAKTIKQLHDWDLVSAEDKLKPASMITCSLDFNQNLVEGVKSNALLYKAVLGFKATPTQKTAQALVTQIQKNTDKIEQAVKLLGFSMADLRSKINEVSPNQAAILEAALMPK